MPQVHSGIFAFCRVCINSKFGIYCPVCCIVYLARFVACESSGHDPVGVAHPATDKQTVEEARVPTPGTSWIIEFTLHGFDSDDNFITSASSGKFFGIWKVLPYLEQRNHAILCMYSHIYIECVNKVKMI